ncbi:unnamed protein product [Notodromas monacha]|uniref:glutathione-specific gamma-glutamylcyclotransferase n=1 Tax=Notodromas monacha TaxID=399045 RepID=A0A7R9BD61_9CRUS|nr:unnamed protein product [Notodromas monacha]CAG0912473.1 unnamed protein product [Notodromas monacha]
MRGFMMAQNHMPMKTEKRQGKRLWVFGYGSLCWYPGFPYEKEIAGYIKGFSRRFWQGNTAHRGRPGKPGRVATLVKEPEGVTWGKAYELKDEIAYEYLEQREGALGGYTHVLTWFWPLEDSTVIAEQVQVMVYMATPDSPQWLGPIDLSTLAAQVARSQGAAGHNAEYVLRLADFMRVTFPATKDDHLFELEALVLKELELENVSISEVMNMKHKIDPAASAFQAAREEKEKVFQQNDTQRKLNLQAIDTHCSGSRCLTL